jgi:hypothetical protein
MEKSALPNVQCTQSRDKLVDAIEEQAYGKSKETNPARQHRRKIKDQPARFAFAGVRSERGVHKPPTLGLELLNAL